MPDETPATPATPAPPAIPPAVLTQPPAAKPPADPGAVVTIPLDQLTAFTAMQARLAHMEAETSQREAAAQAEQARILAQKGDIEAALRLQQQNAETQINTERNQRNASEERAKRYAVDAELSGALASQPLVPGGVDQLKMLWRNQLVVEASGDSYAVRTPTFQNVNDFVAAQLAQPHYAHFLRSTNAGGAGAKGADLSTPTPPSEKAAEPQPKNAGEAILMDFANRQKAAGGDPRMNVSLPFGTKRLG